ncbi:hypothetical protein BC939DRAFT_174208 [Gamsiella multidivaricata]|uniref:uncharacterized protein n=1 Tax=Gamsiella multidivaricata TaxID=101098 RepID=UPI00221EC307|nr:uncharacterized protein BC939DRAFT_174208 [Gamsiella multidivaricata]KAI7822944.1 hypothetical protein BC939DRAFT_174208 [Gamsiella multidivaricata]
MVATPMALRKSTSKCMGWMLVTALVASVGLLRGVSAACAPCDNAESVLKPCNSSLQMNTWPGIYVYQPTDAQAQCACNQNFYDLMVSCLSCQSSTSAKLSVAPLDQYQLVCQSLGQTEFPKVYVPGQTSTTTTAAPSTNTPLATSGSNSGNNGAGHSNLSSGAVAGIVVSAIISTSAHKLACYEP